MEALSLHPVRLAALAHYKVGKRLTRIEHYTQILGIYHLLPHTRSEPQRLALSMELVKLRSNANFIACCR